MTDKQFSYLKSLLVRDGHAHPTTGLRQSGKDICGVPRSAMSWSGLRAHLSSKDASRVIGKLKGQ